VLDSSALQPYAGNYHFNAQANLTVTREGSQLFVQLSGQPKFEIYPESRNKFFLTVVDAEIEFARDEDWKVSKAVLYQNGSTQDAPRIK
jgi:Domain of unknown function (DUF3471)